MEIKINFYDFMYFRKFKNVIKTSLKNKQIIKIVKTVNSLVLRKNLIFVYRIDYKSSPKFIATQLKAIKKELKEKFPKKSECSQKVVQA